MFLEPAPKHGEKDSLWPRILSYAVYVLFWVLFTATGLWLMFEFRSLIVDLMIMARLNPWAVRGYDRLGIFILGLMWFVAMLFTEHYLRSSIGKNRLWRNIGRAAIVHGILVAVALGVRFLIRVQS